jgi:hypothetical protein
MYKASIIPYKSLCDKSMAYVGNIAAFIKYHLENTKPGWRTFAMCASFVHRTPMEEQKKEYLDLINNWL